MKLLTNRIGDFGCGEARIAQSFPDRKVHSFDLVAGNSFITPCNIAKVTNISRNNEHPQVPLKDDSLDISIFCLSLMGRDWPLFILEGTRCLKKGGTLKIVEVMSRFKNLTSFIAFIRSLGYEKINEEKPNNSDYFIFLQFELKRKKVEKGLLILDEISTLLLPCPYKRR
ncbi:S-adenosyl-L-methionine-dependent methyltransferase superfamily protein [Babesia gibsoni]|uniref:Ribosomal RNA-processing protein 8 n=1 Tax=Babesia gibsoni TaxID=33632 RepID=A0AAD8LR09_BABGI|nr:S-adenosyl-L-methionine-dependent methyltransferase superfamily protein [Babesia gibsoni]